MKTIVLTFVLVHYVCTYLLFQTWRRTRGTFAGTGLFMADYLCQSTGATLALLRGVIPAFASVILANMLMFGGVTLFAFGMGKFLNVAVPRKVYAAVIILFTALYCFYTYEQPDIRMRTIVFAGMLIPVFLHVVYMIMHQASADDRRHAFHVGVTFLLFTALYVARTYTAYSGRRIVDFYDNNFVDAAMLMLTMLLCIILIYSIELMISSKLFQMSQDGAREKDELLKKMRRLATRDHLTGVLNRRRIEEIVQHEAERHKRLGQPFSVILCDIDHFKAINDRYGHDAGDRAIVHAIGLLSAQIREVDRLGRWGGEEFLIVTPGEELSQAFQTADRLRRVVANHPVDHDGEATTITLSFGIAEFGPGMDADTVIKHADQALYRAKQAGRNRVEA